MTDEELWAKAYFAALNGLLSKDYEQPHVASCRAMEYADEFIGDLQNRRATLAKSETQIKEEIIYEPMDAVRVARAVLERGEGEPFLYSSLEVYKDRVQLALNAVQEKLAHVEKVETYNEADDNRKWGKISAFEEVIVIFKNFRVGK